MSELKKFDATILMLILIAVAAIAFIIISALVDARVESPNLAVDEPQIMNEWYEIDDPRTGLRSVISVIEFRTEDNVDCIAVQRKELALSCDWSRYEPRE
jgi:hypothetical protein